MWCIKSNKINDFLMENGLYPEYENSGLSFYRKSEYLRALLDEYAIQDAFNNKGEY
jgi:hypothetical protein